MPDQSPAESPRPAGGASSPAAVQDAPSRPAAPPKPEVASLTPLQMISVELKSFLEEKLASGDPVTVEARKETFTGRIFRLNLEEGWIALEHEDGRRRAMYVIEGGRIADGARQLPLGSASSAAGHAP